MDREKALEKIKKCIALGKSCEPAEAAAAMRQAQKLMAVHNLDMTDLERAQVGEVDVRSRASVSKPKAWEVRLIRTVSLAFGCNLLWSASSSYAANVFGNFILIGPVDQLQIAKYTADVLTRKLMSARAAYVKTLPAWMEKKQRSQEGDGFCVGWVTEIAKTVYAFAMTEEMKALVDERTEKLKSSDKTTSVKSRPLGQHGLEAGREAASKESLHRPVENTARQQHRISS